MFGLLSKISLRSKTKYIVNGNYISFNASSSILFNFLVICIENSLSLYKWETLMNFDNGQKQLP